MEHIKLGFIGEERDITTLINVLNSLCDGIGLVYYIDDIESITLPDADRLLKLKAEYLDEEE